MLPSKKTEQDRANEYAMSQLINHGSAFSDGKFRIYEYFSQEHTRKEKAKFLSNEFGWSGYTGYGESIDYRPNKGITTTRTDKEHPENNIDIHLTYPQVADLIDQLIAEGRYITPKDIEDRQNRAIHILKTYDPNNPIQVSEIEKAKAILDSYNIDYSQLLANQPIVETATSEEIEQMNAAIPDDAELPDINSPSAPDEPEETVYSEMGLEAPKPVVRAEIGLSEHGYIDDILDRIKERTGGVSFAMANALIEYLDEKQHLERLNPAIHAGWYKKTDFTITAVIDGEDYSYNGRFDIGDGKGTGGSLIEHISDFINYTLAPTNPYHLSDDELAEQQKVKDIVIPFLREHEKLTQVDQFFVNRLKHIYPTRVSEEQYQSLVGKTVDYNGRQYVVDRIDIGTNKAHIRDDNTGWYPFFQDVELRDIVGQNIDLILDEKEQFFRDCDLPALLAKSSLAWDEIESLGYFFYEQGYIDRVRPTDAVHYGNGYYAQTEAFELARRYQNGEDISKELVKNLFETNRGTIPQTEIPFEDSYLEDLRLQISQTDTGYLVFYGGYSREVTFEEMAQAYLTYFKNELADIQKAVAEEEAHTNAQKTIKELCPTRVSKVQKKMCQ